METKYFDALIIGSGFGAAPPALRLTRAGFTTAVIEKGPYIDPTKDFKITQDPKYLLTYLKSLKNKSLTMNYIEGLGGGSGFFEKIVLRAPKMVFDQADKEGRKLWPDGIDRKKMDPYYRIAEIMIKAHQISTKNIPKTGLVFSKLMKNLGYSVDRCRYADSFCSGCGYCVFGCTHNGKESLLVNYLPKAVDHGTKIYTDKEVISVRPILDNPVSKPKKNIKNLPYQYEAEVKDTQSNQKTYFRSKLLILAAGTLGTAKILLKSKQHFERLSTQAGKNIAINGSVKAVAILPEWYPDMDMYIGQSHPGMVSYEFFNSKKIMISAAKALPLQLFGTGRISINGNKNYWGKEHMNLMKKYRKRIIILDAHGVTPPSAELNLSNNGQLAVKMKVKKDLRSYYHETRRIMESILLDNGCTLVNIDFLNRKGQNYKDLHFHTAHQVGSCRMGANEEMGVVDSNGEVFNYPGMFITDGAAIPSSTGVNISLTILANSERITKGIMNNLSSL